MIRRQRTGGEGLGCCLYWGFCSKAKAGQGELFRLASLNNFGKFWAIEVVTSPLAPGPGMIMAEEYFLLGCKGQIEGIWLWTR